MHGLKLGFPWRTLAAAALVLLALGPAAPAAAPERVAPAPASPLTPIGEALQAGNVREADRLRDAVVDRLRAAAQPTTSDYMLLYRLECLYRDAGYFQKAEDTIREMVALAQRLSPADPSAVFLAEVELAKTYRLRENYVLAGQQYQVCQEFLENSKIRNDPSMNALLLNNLGKLYEMTGQYREAADAYEGSLRRLQKQTSDTAKKDRARALNNLGWLYFVDSAHHTRAEALDLVKRAMDIRKAVYGADDPNIGESFNNLGLIEYALGGHEDEAQRDFEESLRIYKALPGPVPPMVATVEHNLGCLYASRRQFNEALEHHRNSIDILERIRGKHHPDVAAAHGYLAALYAAEPDLPAAAMEIDTTRRILREHIRRVLSAESENEQLAFLRNKDERWFDAAMTIALRVGADPRLGVDPRSSAMAAAWVVNGKDVIPEVLGRRPALARQVQGDDRAKEDYDRLLEVRNEMAADSLRAGAADAGHEEALIKREAQLSHRLALELPNSPHGDRDWVDLVEVRKALAKDPVLAGDAVLIEFVRFTPIDFQAPGAELTRLPAHYAAWVIPPEGDGLARVVDLGPADVIDREVGALRDTVKEAAPDPDKEREGTIRALGERGSEQLYKKRSRELGRLLLDKVDTYAGRYPRWVISPDGNLWLVPWSALVLPDKAGSYAVEKHTISLVASGRDLLAAPPKGVERTAPVILANAAFGRPPKSGLYFPQLESSAAEAKAVEPLLAQYTGTAPVVKTGAEATEQFFRQRRSPKAVVLSTHGFFLEKTEGHVLQENPFLRCGLALAGANVRNGAAANDGMLLGLEILNTDLRGTDLVVLSACDTALGEVRDGEGVADLESAFQLAGAQSVVATLWEVPDNDTKELMTAFFRHLADDHMDKARALQEAQKDRIDARRRTSKRAAHPLFWGAVTLTGQWARTLDQ